MLSLRNRFGIPGVISVIALVFAMMGGAYAAENSGDGATASAKKNNKRGKNNRKGKGGVNVRQVRRIARQEARKFAGQGPIGPQGVPGLPGAPGQDGDDGSDGDNGSNGKEGKQGPAGDSVVSNSFDGESEPGSEPCEGAGGTEFEVEGSGNPEYVCNGSGGGFAATLPPGATQTGAFNTTIGNAGAGFARAPISFAIPLASPLATANAKVVKVGETAPEACENTEHAGTAGPENPEADSGHLCVYLSKESGTGTLLKAGSTVDLDGGASTAGAYLSLFGGTEGAQVRGTYAVTG